MLPLLLPVISWVTSYKWIIIGIAFAALLGFATVQTYRIDSYQKEIALYVEHEIAYKATIKSQNEMIGNIQKLVDDNERAFQEYVKATQDRVDIVKGATQVIVPKGQEAELGIVDRNTSDRMINFFNTRFTEMQTKLGSQ